MTLIQTNGISGNFDRMTEDILPYALLCCTNIPMGAMVLSSMCSTVGSLGLQNPWSTAIPSFIFNIKCCLGYANEGIWIGHNYTSVNLPPQVLSLFNNWRSPPSKNIRIFWKYWMDIASLCVSDKVENRWQHSLFQSLFNTCHKLIKTAT